MTPQAAQPPANAIAAALDAIGVGYERPEPGAYLIRLDGQQKLATMTSLIAVRGSRPVR